MAWCHGRSSCRWARRASAGWLAMSREHGRRSPLRRSAIHRCSPARHRVPSAAGFVKNAVNGQGVAGVNLTFTSGPNVGKSVVTGVDGSYTFSSLLQVPLGTLEVRTSARS